jgi:hypothetical protein
MMLPAYNGVIGRRDPGMFRRMWAMIVKEFVQMRRDRMTFATMLFVPVLQLICSALPSIPTPSTCRRRYSRATRVR